VASARKKRCLVCCKQWRMQYLPMGRGRILASAKREPVNGAALGQITQRRRWAEWGITSPRVRGRLLLAAMTMVNGGRAAHDWIRQWSQAVYACLHWRARAGVASVDRAFVVGYILGPSGHLSSKLQNSQSHSGKTRKNICILRKSPTTFRKHLKTFYFQSAFPGAP